MINKHGIQRIKMKRIHNVERRMKAYEKIMKVKRKERFGN